MRPLLSLKQSLRFHSLSHCKIAEKLITERFHGLCEILPVFVFMTFVPVFIIIQPYSPQEIYSRSVKTFKHNINPFILFKVYFTLFMGKMQVVINGRKGHTIIVKYVVKRLSNAKGDNMKRNNKWLDLVLYILSAEVIGMSSGLLAGSFNEFFQSITNRR